MRRTHIRSSVDIDGESVGYSCLEIDARSDARRLKNKSQNKLDGNLAVYLPGHVQPVDAARQLHAAIVQASRAGVLWSIDIDPPKGGDPIKAAALIEILHQQVLGTLFENPDIARKEFKVTIIGWSHGGAEALRAAELAPEIIDCVIGLCSAGLDSHTTFRLIRRLPREITRVTRDAYRKRSERLRSSLRLGIQLTQGFATDLAHTRSPIRLVNDLRWVGKKVVGPQYGYPGSVVIVMGDHDAFFHWRRLFPLCDRIEDLPDHLDHFARQEFPNVRGFDLQVLPGNHLAPELHAPEYLQTASESLQRMGLSL
jgi:pimeloyl-ACP methyl ester carboxylesterase